MEIERIVISDNDNLSEAQANSRPQSLRERLATMGCNARSRTDSELHKIETVLLSSLDMPYYGRHVDLPKFRQMWTLTLGDHHETDNTPVVLVHGFGAGSALWMRNFDVLASNRAVYAIDLIGFGRSSRSQLESNPDKTAEDWADTLEHWRENLGLESMYLLGHSLGGYLSSLYALRYPHRVKRLILVEPWGYSEPPRNGNGQTVIQRPFLIRGIIKLMFIFHPLSILRVAGPFGPRIIERVRPDLGRKYAHNAELASYIYKYIYHCNSQSPPSGESAFKRMVDQNGFPKIPMIRQIGQLPLSVPISMILGSDSWVKTDIGIGTQMARAAFHDVDTAAAMVDFHVIEDAGHHLYVEQSDKFNELLSEILNRPS